MEPWVAHFLTRIMQLQDIIEGTRNFIPYFREAGMQIPCQAGADGMLVVRVFHDRAADYLFHCK